MSNCAHRLNSKLAILPEFDQVWSSLHESTKKTIITLVFTTACMKTQTTIN